MLERKQEWSDKGLTPKVKAKLLAAFRLHCQRACWTSARTRVSYARLYLEWCGNDLDYVGYVRFLKAQRFSEGVLRARRAAAGFLHAFVGLPVQRKSASRGRELQPQIVAALESRRDPIMAWLFGKTRCRETCEEIYQEAALRLARWPPPPEVPAFAALFRAVRSTLLDFMRKGDAPELSFLEIENLHSRTTRPDTRVFLREVLSMLGQIEGVGAHGLRIRCETEDGWDQIACRLGVRERVLERQVATARRDLRDRLGMGGRSAGTDL
jgi:hypothetical protein